MFDIFKTDELEPHAYQQFYRINAALRVFI